MTREEAILWLQVLKHSKINWVGEQAEDKDIIARCEQAEQEAFDMAIEALQDKPQGEWKQTITWQPYCSNCEYVFDEDEEYSPLWKFCPMCGAEMADNSLVNDITESSNDVVESQNDVITEDYMWD